MIFPPLCDEARRPASATKERGRVAATTGSIARTLVHVMLPVVFVASPPCVVACVRLDATPPEDLPSLPLFVVTRRLFLLSFPRSFVTSISPLVASTRGCAASRVNIVSHRGEIGANRLMDVASPYGMRPVQSVEDHALPGRPPREGGNVAEPFVPETGDVWGSRGITMPSRMAPLLRHRTVLCRCRRSGLSHVPRLISRTVRSRPAAARTGTASASPGRGRRRCRAPGSFPGG